MDLEDRTNFGRVMHSYAISRDSKFKMRLFEIRERKHHRSSVND